MVLPRLTARLTCPKCGATFNKLFQPPVQAGICDACGAELTQRKDDTEEAGRKRLANYHSQSEPMVDYYKAQGILLPIDGAMGLEKITEAIIAGLEGMA